MYSLGTDELNSLISEYAYLGLKIDLLRKIKTGKEAEVFLCRHKNGLVALKI